MIVIAVTNVEWFKTLRGLPTNDVINFWRPGTANFRALKPGEHFYFLLASPIRKIGGYGIFSGFERMSIPEAWREFGERNGARSINDLITRLEQFENTLSNTQRTNSDIGCIRLANPVFLDDTDFMTSEELGVEFSKSIVTYKSYPGLTELSI